MHRRHSRSERGSRFERPRTLIRWRIAAPLARLLACVALAASPPRTAAQQLDLDPPPVAPPLPTSNAASALAALLAEEVEHLSRRRADEETEARALAASIAWRRLAHELLMRGDDAADRRDDLVVSGFRLADARGEFDGAIARLPSQGGRAADAIKALERFIASPGKLRAAPADDLASALEAALAGLEPVLDALGLPRAANAWPSIEHADASAIEQALPGARLAAAARDSALPAAIAQQLAALAESITAAEFWPDLRPEAALLATPLLRVPEAVRVVEGAGWLPASLRDSLRQRWSAALELIADPRRRSGGLRELAALEALAGVIDTAAPLLRPRSGDAPRGPIDPARLLKAVRSLEAPVTDEPSARSAIERARMIESLLETMTEARRRETKEVRREFRVLRRDLSRDALRTEDSVLRQIEVLAAPEAAPTDPAVASLLENQRRRLRAIRALDEVDAALTDIEARMPAHARPLILRSRGWLSPLSDPARSETALRRCEAFVRQWSRLRGPAAEAAIRRGDAEAVALCAGRATEVLASLDRRREAWADAWADGDADRAEEVIQPMLELLELIDDAAALARSRANPRLIGRWGGWDDLGGIPGATDAMDARIAVAVESLVRGDGKALREALALQRREAPLWRLRARLVRLLADSLASLPTGLPGAIGRAGTRPGADSFLAERAESLFTLARMTREYLHASSSGARAEAERLNDFVRSIATDLLRDLDSVSAVPKTTSAPTLRAPPSPPASTSTPPG